MEVTAKAVFDIMDMISAINGGVIQVVREYIYTDAAIPKEL